MAINTNGVTISVFHFKIVKENRKWQIGVGDR